MQLSGESLLIILVVGLVAGWLAGVAVASCRLDICKESAVSIRAGGVLQVAGSQ